MQYRRPARVHRRLSFHFESQCLLQSHNIFRPHYILLEGGEADHYPPSGAEVKKAMSYTSAHPLRLHGVVLN